MIKSYNFKRDKIFRVQILKQMVSIEGKKAWKWDLLQKAPNCSDALKNFAKVIV